MSLVAIFESIPIALLVLGVLLSTNRAKYRSLSVLLSLYVVGGLMLYASWFFSATAGASNTFMESWLLPTGIILGGGLVVVRSLRSLRLDRMATKANATDGPDVLAFLLFIAFCAVYVVALGRSLHII